MTEPLTDRIDSYFKSLPPPTGRTSHQMQPETLLSECRTTLDLQGSVIIGYQNRVAELEAALKKVWKLYPFKEEEGNVKLQDMVKRFIEVGQISFDALAGEKKDD
jgi:hypothetical protein